MKLTKGNKPPEIPLDTRLSYTLATTGTYSEVQTFNKFTESYFKSKGYKNAT